MNIWVDPPEGWKYGFPLVYNQEKDGDCLEWMVRCGYPRKLIDSYGDHFYTRQWEAKNEQEDTTFNS